MTASITTETLVDGRYFCEAPRWHGDRFWFSDFYAHEVASVGLGGDVRVECPVPDDRPSGLGWLPDGRLLVVAMQSRRVMRLEPDGQLVTHADLSDIATFHANDMLVDDRGRAYVGNFGFDLDATLAELGPDGAFGALLASPTDFMAKLALVSPNGEVTVAADELLFPNGMVLLDGGDTLVVAQTFGFELTAFTRSETGTLGDRRPWASLTLPDGTFVMPDGIAVDAERGIWVADALGQGVLRVEEGGEITHRVTTSQTAFACGVGGPDGRHLLVCTAPSSDAATASASPGGKLEIAEF